MWRLIVRIFSSMMFVAGVVGLISVPDDAALWPERLRPYAMAIERDMIIIALLAASGAGFFLSLVPQSWYRSIKDKARRMPRLKWYHPADLSQDASYAEDQARIDLLKTLSVESDFRVVPQLGKELYEVEHERVWYKLSMDRALDILADGIMREWKLFGRNVAISAITRDIEWQAYKEQGRFYWLADEIRVERDIQMILREAIVMLIKVGVLEGTVEEPRLSKVGASVVTALYEQRVSQPHEEHHSRSP